MSGFGQGECVPEQNNEPARERDQIGEIRRARDAQVAETIERSYMVQMKQALALDRIATILEEMLIQQQIESARNL
jgi:hypothetical protein